MGNELTTKNYWEKYYSSASTVKETMERICSEEDIFFNKFIAGNKSRSESILEIGTFPGRYLAYLASKFKLKPTGLDFNSDCKKIGETMNAFNIAEYEYINEDFLKYQPSKKFDLVFSLGFIEHFTNYDEILDKHVDCLNDGGALLIIIPNKRYLRYLYGILIDHDNLKKHNLNCMKKKVFLDFSKRNNLDIKELTYYGGFQYRVHQNLNFFQKLIYYPVRFISKKMNKILSKHPSKWYSTGIVAIFSK